MTPTPPAVDLPSIDQLGIVVERIDDAMDHYASLLGIEPWTGYDFTAENLEDAIYRGQSVTHGYRLALADIGGLHLELIEPVTGPTIYHDHLRGRGEGLHHVAYYAADYDELQAFVDVFEERGVLPIQRGAYEGTEFVYFDTRPHLDGVLLEVVNRVNVDDRDPSFRYPPQD